MKPLNKHILIEKIEQDQVLFTPSRDETRPHFARVTAAPPGMEGVAVNSIVLYRPGMEEPIEFEDIKVLRLHWSHVISVMSNQQEYYDLSTR